MTAPRDPKRLPAALALGLALGLPASSSAQSPGISSGSGAGTGTGTSAGSGYGTTGTGTEAGAGIGSTGTGSESASGTGRNVLPGLGGYGRAPAGRGPLQTLRDEGMGRPMSGVEVGAEEASAIDARLMGQARTVTDPADRALVMDRVARTKIFGQKLTDARAALAEAGQATELIPPGTLRDRRIMSVVATLLALADSEIREGLQPEDAPRPPTTEPGIAPPPEGEADRVSWLDRAAEAWDRASDLASRIGNPDFRGQSLSRVADSRASGAVSIAAEAAQDQAAQAPSERNRSDHPLIARSDVVLLRAVEDASRIDRPVWHDNGLQAVASRAASAGRFARALQAARRIGRPEIRVDAYVRVAEAQSRRDLQQDATATYSEAARAVASMPNDDPRMVMAGILIDSLISSGRFDDARATVPLIHRPSRRLQALGAVAESQGRRGLADAALSWIDRDATPQERPILRRHVIDGMLATVEQYRTNALATERAR